MSPVREFKFACPVCLQHIQCAAASSGQTIACPTCFQNIVVPQAPTGNTTKLILLGTKSPVSHKSQNRTPAPKPTLSARTMGVIGAFSALVIALVMLALIH